MFVEHDSRFSEAFANTRHRVYGKRLLPFSLWHQLLLEHAQSPVYFGAGCTPADLILAARICSTPWNPAFEFPDLTLPGAASIVWHSAGRSFLKELAKFSTYLSDYCSGPKLWESNTAGGPERDIDSILEAATYLVRSTTLTWREVWTMPVGVATWVSVCSQKLEGADINVFTPADEIAKAAHVRKRDAKLAADAKVRAAEQNIPVEEALKAVTAEYWEGIRKHKAMLAAQNNTVGRRR